MKTNPTPKGHRIRSRFIFLEIASYKRCSRPLCSSQTTTPYHTPHTQPLRADTCARCSQETRNTSPGTTHPKGCATRSCCLRTQQCAKHYPTVHTGRVPGPTAPEGKECPYLLPARAARHLFADIPPVSTRRRTIACATGVLLTTPPHPHTRGRVVVGAP